MENHEKIKNIIENAIIDGITYKDEMLAIGRGYDLGSIAELCTRKIERALAETTHDAPAGGLSKHAVINPVCPLCGDTGFYSFGGSFGGAVQTVRCHCGANGL